MKWENGDDSEARLTADFNAKRLWGYRMISIIQYIFSDGPLVENKSSDCTLCVNRKSQTKPRSGKLYFFQMCNLLLIHFRPCFKCRTTKWMQKNLVCSTAGEKLRHLLIFFLPFRDPTQRERERGGETLLFLKCPLWTQINGWTHTRLLGRARTHT